MLSAIAEAVNVDKEGTPSAVSSAYASIAPKSGADASATNANAALQSQHRRGPSGEHMAMDLPFETAGAKRWTTSGTLMKDSVGPDAMGDKAKHASKNTNFNCEYTIDHIACYVTKRVETRVMWKSGTATLHKKTPSSRAQKCLISAGSIDESCASDTLEVTITTDGHNRMNACRSEEKDMKYRREKCRAAHRSSLSRTKEHQMGKCHAP